MNGLLESTIHWLTALHGLPLTLLGLLVAPLLILAAVRRVYPGPSLVVLAIVPTALTFAVAARSDVLPLVLTLDVAILGLALRDLWTIPSAKDITATRSTERIASLRKPHQVTLVLHNLSRRRYRMWVRDDIPQGFRAEPQQFQLELEPRSKATITYKLRASQRGAVTLRTIYLKLPSSLSLWQAFRDIAYPTTLHVYPDMQQLAKYAALARTDRLSLMGVRRTRKIGQDNEFERLRDYTRDDNYKHIDWRSTARRQKLTVKDYQANQSQRLIFMIDSGRMMANQSGGLSLLDHALNAMLMLSFVALRQGDSVGMISFSDRVHSFVPPVGGVKQMNQLLHASFDRFPRLVESRYDEAFLHLSSHCQKRSLVVLITNVIDEVNAQQVLLYLSRLVGRHLTMGLLLRDHKIFDAAEMSRPFASDLYRSAAAAELLTWRHQVLTDLQHKGAIVLDVFPEDMTAPLLNKYLEIKARHLL